jgi:tetratricopeptide (TPR) repeat protein
MGSSPHKTSKSVGRLLRRRREAMGLTLREASRHAAAKGEPIPASTLARIEQGRLDPGVRRLTALVRLYNLDPEHVSDLAELESLAVDQPEGDLATLSSRGYAYWQEGNIPQALAHVFALREYTATDPAQILARQEATLNFALCARGLGKTALAKKLVDELLCEPAHPDVLVAALTLAASLWNKAGSLEVALALIARASANVQAGDVKQAARVRHQEAKLLLEARRPADALAAIDAAIADYAVSAEVYNEMSARVLRIAVLEMLGRPDEAIRQARETIAACDRNDFGRVTISARLELGRLLVAAGRAHEAIDELRRAHAAAELLTDRELASEAHMRVEQAYAAIGRADPARLARTNAARLSKTGD